MLAPFRIGAVWILRLVRFRFLGIRFVRFRLFRLKFVRTGVRIGFLGFRFGFFGIQFVRIAEFRFAKRIVQLNGRTIVLQQQRRSQLHGKEQ